MLIQIVIFVTHVNLNEIIWKALLWNPWQSGSKFSKIFIWVHNYDLCTKIRTMKKNLIPKKNVVFYLHRNPSNFRLNELEIIFIKFLIIEKSMMNGFVGHY